MIETLLIPFSTWLIEKVGEHAFSKVAGSLEINDIDKNFKKAVSITSQQLQQKYPEILGGDIENFFGAGEIFNTLYKLLFKDAIIDINVIKDFLDNSTLPQDFILEFIQTLKSNCLNDRKLNDILANNKLYISVVGISEEINKIAEVSTLSLSEIKEIRELLENRFNEQFSVDEFISKYSKSAVKVLSELNFLGLGVKSHIKKNRKKLSDVYVEPRFVLNEEKSENFSVHLTEDNFFQNANGIVFLKDIFNRNINIVILGNPGSGKSVLVRYLICHLLEKNCHHIISNNDIIDRLPFRVELRKYFQFKKNTGGGIIKYFIKSLESDYGLINITENNIELLFKQCQILIFFDGLDEIFNASDKMEITRDINNLLNNYSSVLSVVTSRVIGYEEAKLPNTNFYELVILDFDDKQIEEYVNKWYLQEEVDVEIRTKEVSEFLRLHKKIDEELIRNPLLLSLIIILFRNNLKLPESKLEIYQSCTKTLVDKWDLTKELRIELPEEISKRKETLFADLAFWQYERLSSENVKITNRLATAKIADSIINKLKITEDWILAESLAEGFMNYALKRSLYFDNNFTHKTFLEYFTAYWIFSNIEKKHRTEERNEIISKYIDIAFWSIVLELLINMIDQDQADTEIIDDLFNYQIEAKPSGLAFLLEITSFLKNISYVTVTNLVNSTINYLITEPKKRTRRDLGSRHFRSLITFVNNNDTQLKTFKQVFYDYTKTQQNRNTLKTLILLYFELCFHHRNYSFVFDEKDFYNEAKTQELINNDAQLFFFQGVISKNHSETYLERLLHALEYFNETEIFRDYESLYEQYYFEGSFFNNYLYWQLRAQEFNSFERNMNLLFDKGLRRNLVFKHFKNGKFNYFSDLINAEKIIDYINLVSSEAIKKLILLCILWKAKHEGLYRTRDLSFEISKVASKYRSALEKSKYEEFFYSTAETLNLLMFDTPQNKI